MTDKEIFRKTEGRLYRYFKILRLIKCLELECEDLEKQKERIRKEMKETDVVIEEESKAITYEERVQSSSDGTSYAERALIAEIDKLEKEWIYVRKKLLKKRVKIRELERQITPLKYNIGMLSEENKQFIEWKYAEGKSVDWIATEIFGGARATAYRKREELVEDIAQWCNFVI